MTYSDFHSILPALHKKEAYSIVPLATCFQLLSQPSPRQTPLPGLQSLLGERSPNQGILQTNIRKYPTKTLASQTSKRVSRAGYCRVPIGQPGRNFRLPCCPSVQAFLHGTTRWGLNCSTTRQGAISHTF